LSRGHGSSSNREGRRKVGRSGVREYLVGGVVAVNCAVVRFSPAAGPDLRCVVVDNVCAGEVSCCGSDVCHGKERGRWGKRTAVWIT
jgi:hypothetical protein